jgi:hypothetical protein
MTMLDLSEVLMPYTNNAGYLHFQFAFTADIFEKANLTWAVPFYRYKI